MAKNEKRFLANKVDELHDGMNLETYLNLQDAVNVGSNVSLALTFYLTFLSFLRSKGALVGAAMSFGVMSALDSYTKYSKDSKAHLKTREIRQVYSYYKEFVKNLVRENKNFGFESGIAIATAFNKWIANNDYRSDNLIGSKTEDFINVLELQGANFLIGSNESLHVSSLLTDILNESGIKAHTVTLNTDKKYEDIDSRDLLTDMVKSGKNKTFTMITEYDESFLFDPLTGDFYTPVIEKDDPLKSNRYRGSQFIPTDFSITSQTITTEEFQEAFSNPTYEPEEIFEIVNYTKEKYESLSYEPEFLGFRYFYNGATSLQHKLNEIKQNREKPLIKRLIPRLDKNKR